MDSITVGGSIGEQITYKVLATNYAGQSAYSVDLPITVGVVPNSPTTVRIVKILSHSSTMITWNSGAVVPLNPETLSFKVYLDDGFGGLPKLVYDTSGKAITN